MASLTSHDARRVAVADASKTARERIVSGYPTRRLRRLRYNPQLRSMLSSVRLHVHELIAPIFVREALTRPKEIAAMPGQFQFPLIEAVNYASRLADKGVPGILLFGLPARKDATGSGAWADDGIVQTTIAAIKAARPELVVFADTCLCEYTDHGHCGPLVKSGGQVDVDNEGSLACLAKTAVSQARAGADVIAPSAMMDGQVRAIRTALDAAGFERTPILSYAVKFASCLYGPFREAAESAPSFGDRRSYQMDPCSPRQILAEARSDLDEGADMIMVKPAAAYLDVISAVSCGLEAPLAAYHVSGEYAMLKFAAASGALDEKRAVLEVTSGIKRAGADLIITYFAEALADWLA